MALVLSGPVRVPKDLVRFEEAITKCFKGEPGRCAFLRSHAYMRLRLAALYSTTPTNLEISEDRLRVSLANGVVSVSWVDPSEPPDEGVLGVLGKRRLSDDE